MKILNFLHEDLCFDQWTVKVYEDKLLPSSHLEKGENKEQTKDFPTLNTF